MGPDQLAQVFLRVGVVGPQDCLELAVVKDVPPVMFAVDFVQLCNALDHQTDVDVIAAQGSHGGGNHWELSKPGELVHQQQRLTIACTPRTVFFGPALQMPNQLDVHKVDRSTPLINFICGNTQENVIVIEVAPIETACSLALAPKRMADIRIGGKKHELVAHPPVNVGQGFRFHDSHFSEENPHTNVLALHQRFT